jgi:hypothetical protein
MCVKMAAQTAESFLSRHGGRRPAIHAFDRPSKRRGYWPPVFAGACFTDMTYCAVRYVNINAGWYKLPVVSRRHFFSVAPDWSHATGTMMVALGDLRGFVGE